jgi:hypothetical protein
MTDELVQESDEKKESIRFMCDGMLVDCKKVLEARLNSRVISVVAVGCDCEAPSFLLHHSSTAVISRMARPWIRARYDWCDSLSRISCPNDMN